MVTNMVNFHIITGFRFGYAITRCASAHCLSKSPIECVYHWHVVRICNIYTFMSTQNSASDLGLPWLWQPQPLTQLNLVLSTSFWNSVFSLECQHIFITVEYSWFDTLKLNSALGNLFNTMQCHYNMVNFLQNTHKRHAIIALGAFCELKVWSMFYVIAVLYMISWYIGPSFHGICLFLKPLKMCYKLTVKSLI